VLNIIAFVLDVINEHTIWLYVACLLGILWNVRAYVAAQHERSNTIFTIEREVAAHREGRAMANIGLMLGLAILVAGTTPAPVATAEPTPTSAPVVAPAACGDPNIRITSPGSGATVSGQIAIAGTADDGAFQFYKVEIGAGSDPAQWSVIDDIRRQPVHDGTLITLNTAALPNGTYTIRLVVVDATSNFAPPCQVTFTIQN
jgi:hypothetical protein